ncbi:MAG: helix-turn-helix domain-containing protein [Rhodobacter sp.]|nr:helix-turn-helix domain-containing protein [Rhodobacter sp.]
MSSAEATDTRSRILEAARRLLVDGAGAATRMSDIAKAAGVSRQAVYLHFESRAALLIAVTKHMDAVLGVQERLKPTRAARNGEDRVKAFVAFWGAYVPEIYTVARALMAMRDSDAAAREAWDGRMAAVREGCAAAIAALEREGRLRPNWTLTTATDLFWAMLSVPVWEQLTQGCGWSSTDYIERIQTQALATFATPG